MSNVRQKWRWLACLIPLAAMIILLYFEQEVYSAQNRSLAPEFSHPAGKYDHDIQLEISSSHQDAVTYFTLDGRNPDPQNGTQYIQPLDLEISEPQVIVVRAQSYLADGTTGPVSSATYFMGLDNSLPLLSIIVDPEDFWGAEKGIYTNHDQRGLEWERPVDLTYVTGQNDQGFHIGAGLRIHGGWTRFFSDKKSLRLYFREKYGAPKLNYPLFGQEGQIAFDHLVLHNSDKDLIPFKNQLVERLTEQMAGFAPRSQPTLLFINGVPWGIYNIRERIDERLLTQNYEVPAADISDTPNNRGMQSAVQLAIDTVHWENLMDFVLENDLANRENYAFLQTQMDLPNFVDYYLLQMFVANSDWPHHNVEQFRPRTPGGRWEWIVWDDDFAFERVEQQMVDHVLKVEHPLGKRMEILLNKLLANPGFRNLFLTRAADLLNTTLSSSNVTASVDELVLEFEPDINYEKKRWDISADWADSVDHMREFADKRPDIMRQHFVDSMGLAGTAQISVGQNSEDAGWVVINDSAAQTLPWQGIYFKGTNVQIQAIPPARQQFSGWEGDVDLADRKSSLIMVRVEDDMVISPIFVPVNNETPQPNDVVINSVVINDSGEIEGDWFELQINREDGVDLAGWRITDNDSIEAQDEGSLIFLADPLLNKLPKGTIMRLIATQSHHNAQEFTEDGWKDGILYLYAGNSRIDSTTDPWFNLGSRDNLVILAPGSSIDPADDVPIDFWSNIEAFRPSSFGLPPR